MSSNPPYQNSDGDGGGMKFGPLSADFCFSADPSSGQEPKTITSLPPEEGRRLLDEDINKEKYATAFNEDATFTTLPQLPSTSSQLFQDDSQISATTKVTAHGGDGQRKTRKNAKSRERAKHLKQQVKGLKIKPSETKTPEENELERTVEERRVRKNNRSKERALEKKSEMDRILNIPEASRTPEDIKTLGEHKSRRKRKSEGDKLRRKKLRHLGLKKKPADMSIRARHGRDPSGMSSLPPTSQESAFAQLPDGTVHPEESNKGGSDWVEL